MEISCTSAPEMDFIRFFFFFLKQNVAVSGRYQIRSISEAICINSDGFLAHISLFDLAFECKTEALKSTWWLAWFTNQLRWHPSPNDSNSQFSMYVMNIRAMGEMLTDKAVIISISSRVISDWITLSLLINIHESVLGVCLFTLLFYLVWIQSSGERSDRMTGYCRDTPTFTDDAVDDVIENDVPRTNLVMKIVVIAVWWQRGRWTVVVGRLRSAAIDRSATAAFMNVGHFES